jgi:hypothetical protein
MGTKLEAARWSRAVAFQDSDDRFFFFKKKKQKTFDFWCAPIGQRALGDKSLLVLFFKKDHSFLP